MHALTHDYLGEVVAHVFRVRSTHPLPRQLPDPPSAWREGYAAATADLGLPTRSVAVAMALVRGFWTELMSHGEER